MRFALEKFLFTAEDVHDGGYLLPLEAVRNNAIMENQSMHILCDIFWITSGGFISPPAFASYESLNFKAVMSNTAIP